MKEGDHDSGGGFYLSKFKSLCPVGPLPLRKGDINYYILLRL